MGRTMSFDFWGWMMMESIYWGTEWGVRDIKEWEFSPDLPESR